MHLKSWLKTWMTRPRKILRSKYRIHPTSARRSSMMMTKTKKPATLRRKDAIRKSSLFMKLNRSPNRLVSCSRQNKEVTNRICFWRSLRISRMRLGTSISRSSHRSTGNTSWTCRRLCTNSMRSADWETTLCRWPLMVKQCW